MHFVVTLNQNIGSFRHKPPKEKKSDRKSKRARVSCFANVEIGSFSSLFQQSTKIHETKNKTGEKRSIIEFLPLKNPLKSSVFVAAAELRELIDQGVPLFLCKICIPLGLSSSISHLKLTKTIRKTNFGIFFPGKT